MTDNIINCVKIIYDIEPCKKCGGQIMTIFVMNEMIYRKCIKCDNNGIKPWPDCEEERIGRLMHIYYTTGVVVDKY
jgi:hypothetical protein